MQSNLTGFIQVLRTHDVRVSPAETLDAMTVATTLGYADRTLLRDGLAMTLAKTPEEEAVFIDCFDRYFDQRLSDFSRQDDAEDNAAEDSAAEHDTPPEQDTDESSGQGGDEASPLVTAAAQDGDMEALLASPLMQSLVNNDRNDLTVAIGRAAEQVGLRQI